MIEDSEVESPTTGESTTTTGDSNTEAEGLRNKSMIKQRLRTIQLINSRVGDQ